MSNWSRQDLQLLNACLAKSQTNNFQKQLFVWLFKIVLLFYLSILGVRFRSTKKHCFKGLINQIYMWDRVLPQAQVLVAIQGFDLRDVTTTGHRTGLIALYAMQEGSGAAVHEVLKLQGTASMSGAVWVRDTPYNRGNWNDSVSILAPNPSSPPSIPPPMPLPITSAAIPPPPENGIDGDGMTPPDNMFNAPYVFPPGSEMPFPPPPQEDPLFPPVSYPVPPLSLPQPPQYPPPPDQSPTMLSLPPNPLLYVPSSPTLSSLLDTASPTTSPEVTTGPQPTTSVQADSATRGQKRTSLVHEPLFLGLLLPIGVVLLMVPTLCFMVRRHNRQLLQQRRDYAVEMEPQRSPSRKALLAGGGQSECALVSPCPSSEASPSKIYAGFFTSLRIPSPRKVLPGLYSA